MESLKQFLDALKGKIENALNEGDVFKANEIEANMMLGAILLMMSILSIACLALNEFGVFSANKVVMRASVIISLVIEIPILIINQNLRGEASWLKHLLTGGILFVSGILSVSLGHNVTLIMAIPIILSVRYCEVNFTRKVAVATIIVFALACVGNAFVGIVNLNSFNVPMVPSGTSFTIIDKLRTSIEAYEIDHVAYLKSSFINDFLPRLITFSVIGFSCVAISRRGRSMTEMQDTVTKKTSRLETELNLATEIQASMLPCIFPAFPEHGELDLFAINVPAKEVGGDFYDYFVIDEDHVAFVMADVSGKGVGAALFMTISKIVLKNQLQICDNDPAKAMEIANNQLCENNDAELFVTVWAGIYEISTMTLTYVNAGHNPPIISRKNETPGYLSSKRGFVLAGFENSKYQNNIIKLNVGDEVFLYTDGVTEANNKNNDLYGEERLLTSYEKVVNSTVKEQINYIMEDLKTFMKDTEQFDDITMLGIKIKDKE